MSHLLYGRYPTSIVCVILSTPLLPVPLNPATNTSYRVYNVRIIANNIIHGASPLPPLPPPSLRILYDTPKLSRALTQSSDHPAFPQMDILVGQWVPWD